MKTEYTDEDMAAVGRALMQAIEQHAPKGWHPSECPSEIVADLAAQLDDVRAAIRGLVGTREGYNEMQWNRVHDALARYQPPPKPADCA